MKLTATGLVSFFVFAIAFSSAPASAAQTKKVVATGAVAAAPADVVELGRPPRGQNPNDDKDNNPNDGDAGRGNDDKPPKPDKPPRSVVNPNDDKDNDPDDGDAGRGNDDRKKKNDGPAND